MTARRYGDDEVREIFSLATTGEGRDQVLPAESEGLTLDELQRIGQEAGIEPARIADAARRLAVAGTPATVRRSFGLPIEMSRLVELPRAPSDREWEQLIAECRTTFGTLGRVTTSGGLREWSDGELEMSVEPTAHGEQLRLRALKSDAMVLNGVGTLTGGMSLLMSAVVASTGQPSKALAVLGTFGGMALAAFGANVVRSPRWARERARQMDALAARAVSMLSSS